MNAIESSQKLVSVQKTGIQKSKKVLGFFKGKVRGRKFQDKPWNRSTPRYSQGEVEFGGMPGGLQ